MLRKDMALVLSDKLRAAAMRAMNGLDSPFYEDDQPDQEFVKYACWIDGVMEMLRAAIDVVKEETDGQTD